jgi:predicted membrane protein
MIKLTEYQCFKDYNSYKLKNSIRITKKQKEKYAALKEKCNLLSPELSYFDIEKTFIIVLLLSSFIYYIVFAFWYTDRQIFGNKVACQAEIFLIIGFLILTYGILIALIKLILIRLYHNRITKNLKQIEETISQFETSLAEDVEDSDLKQIERFLAPESTTYGKLTESIIKNQKQEQQYRFKSFSIEDIYLGNKKNHVILVGTNAGESKDKIGNVYERQWKRRYTIIHKKGVVRISDMEDLQMR